MNALKHSLLDPSCSHIYVMFQYLMTVSRVSKLNIWEHTYKHERSAAYIRISTRQ